MRKKAGFWDYDNCYLEAKKYSTNEDFRLKSAVAYSVSRKNGWLKDFTWLIKKTKGNNYWSYEKCLEEAKKYESLSEFKKESGSAYNISLHHKWLKDFTWLTRKQKAFRYWNYERCYQEALKYKRLIDFYNNSGSAASAALKNKWINEYTWLERQHRLSYEEAYQIALKYKTKKDFLENDQSAYHKSVKNKWIKDFVWIKKDTSPYKNDSDCCYMYLNEEKKIVYVGRTIHPKERDIKHRSKDSRIANIFKSYGLDLPEPIYYMNGVKFPVEYGLMIEDKLVNWFKEQGWTVLNKAQTGISSGSLGQCKKKWTESNIRKCADKCNSSGEFSARYPSAYEVACKKKMLDILFPNRNKFLSKDMRRIKMLSLEGNVLREFSTQAEAYRYLGKQYTGREIRDCFNGHRSSAFGYKWERAEN